MPLLVRVISKELVLSVVVAIVVSIGLVDQHGDSQNWLKPVFPVLRRQRQNHEKQWQKPCLARDAKIRHRKRHPL